jgi:hypothetical protein
VTVDPGPASPRGYPSSANRDRARIDISFSIWTKVAEGTPHLRTRVSDSTNLMPTWSGVLSSRMGPPGWIHATLNSLLEESFSRIGPFAFWLATVVCICCMLRGALTFQSTVQKSFLGLVPKQASFIVAPDPKAAWLSRMAHDRAWRDRWIQQFESNTQVYTDRELEAIAAGEALLDLLGKPDGVSSDTTNSVEYKGRKGCLIATVETLIRSATPLELVAHLLHHDTGDKQSKDGLHADEQDGTWGARVQSRVLEDVNEHHRVVLEELPVPGLPKMTAAFSVLSKMLAFEGDRGQSCVLVFAPRVGHQQANDENPSASVREEKIELHKCFRFTVVGADVTKLEYVSLLDMRRKLSKRKERKSRHSIESYLMSAPRNLRVYFQRLRPLDLCTAEDGKLVGTMLMDVALSKGSCSAAIADFFVRMAMLRDTPFTHFCAMLTAAAEPRSRFSPTAITAAARAAVGKSGTKQNSYVQVETKIDPELLTEHEARLIGRAFRDSVAANKMPSLAAAEIRNMYPAIATLAEKYEWFGPMTEAITVRLMISSVKTQLRVGFYAVLSLFDVFSDVYMTCTFFATAQARTAGAILTLILISTAGQLIIVFLRNKHRDRHAILKELAISLSFFKPVVDARRLACAHEVDGAPYAP